MKEIESVLKYCFHESTLLSMHLDNDKFHFRFAIPEYMANSDYHDISGKEDCSLLVDVICKNCKIKEIYFEDTDAILQNADVLTFMIDSDNNASLYVEDYYGIHGYQIYFICDSYEINEIGIIDYDLIKSLPSLDMSESDYDDVYKKWYKLPY